MAARKARRSKGSVYRKKRENGTLYDGWFIRWADAWGKRRSEFGGRTKDAAEGLLRKRLDEKDASRRTGSREPRLVSLKDFMPQLLRHMTAVQNPVTVRNRKGFLKEAAEKFGNRPMSRISTADLMDWFVELRLERGLAASSLRNHKTTLSAAWKYAVEVGAAATNPVLAMKLARPDPSPIPYMTDEELDRLIAGMPAELLPCVLLHAEAGLRRQEALDLTWQHVDQGFTAVTVCRSKNHKPRIVPLTPRAQTALREHWESLPVERRRADAVLFPMGSSTLNAKFRKAADAVGLPHVKPHTLRHAMATRLGERGAATLAIRDLLGHSSIAITERYMNRAPNNALVQAIGLLSAQDDQGAAEDA